MTNLNSKTGRRMKKEGFLMYALRTVFSLFLTTMLISSSVWAETKVTGEIDAGYQTRDVSSNESKFEEYGEVPDGAVIPHVEVQSVGDHDQASFEGNNIKENNQSYDLQYNHDYKVKVDASYDEMTHVYSNVGQTLYNEVSPGVFRLPAQVQSNMSAQTVGSATTNSQLSSYWSGGHPVGLFKQDDRGAIKLNFNSGEHMKFDLGFSEDDISGHMPGGASFGSSPGGNPVIQLPKPIDQKVYNMKAGSQYNTKDVQLGISYLMSAFQDNTDSLVWDNPMKLTPAGGIPSQGEMTQAPNNWSHTFSLNSGFNLPAKTRFTATESMAYMRQNDALQPYTINTGVATPTGGFPPGITQANVTSTSVLPEQTANAKILTFTQDYALNNRIVKPLNFGVHYHTYQLVNKTADFSSGGIVPLDQAFVVETVGNSHFEYRKELLEGTVDYQVFEPLSLGVKYGTEWETRNDREVRDTTEKILTVTTDFKPARWTLLRGSYQHAHRRPQDFDNGTNVSDDNPTILGELPGLRRFDVADRLRNQGKVLWQLTPGPVTIGFNGSMTHDNFQPGVGDPTGNDVGFNLPGTQYGVLENRDASAGADVSWEASDRLVFDVYYDYEQTKALQRSNEDSLTGNSNSGIVSQAPTNDWTLQTVDRYHLTGISALIGGTADRLNFRLAYDITMSREGTNYMNVGSLVFAPLVNGVTATGSLTDPQDTKYMKQDVSIKTNIKLSDRVSLVLGYLFEKYDVSDWQNQNVPVVGGGTVRTTPIGNGQTNIFLATNLQNYVAHVGSALVKYKF